MAIERVLPPEVRKAAAAQRRNLRVAKRAAMAEARQQARAAQREAREQARPLHRADFVVVGVRFSEERQDACAGLDVGEAVALEREPDNAHDENAILVMSSDDCELGHVPREHASEMAPLLDDGAEVQARVKKLIASSQGRAIPVIVATLYRAGGLPEEAPPAPRLQQSAPPPAARAATVNPPRRAGSPALALYVLVIAILIGLALLME